MRTKNLFKSASAVAAALALSTACASAQVSQFGQYLTLTGPATSSVVAVAPFSIQVPAITLSIVATNPATVVTNDIMLTFTNNGTALTIQKEFIYNAATMGTNFTTNFPTYPLNLSAYAFGYAAPLAGSTNNVQIK